MYETRADREDATWEACADTNFLRRQGETVKENRSASSMEVVNFTIINGFHFPYPLNGYTKPGGS